MLNFLESLFHLVYCKGEIYETWNWSHDGYLNCSLLVNGPGCDFDSSALTMLLLTVLSMNLASFLFHFVEDSGKEIQVAQNVNN